MNLIDILILKELREYTGEDDAEPLPQDHIFRQLDNVLVLPHLGYVSERNYRTYFSEAVEDIQAFLAGAPIRKLN